MKNEASVRFSIFIVLLFLCKAAGAQVTAFENNSGIVVSANGQLHHLRVPQEFKDADRALIEFTLPEVEPKKGGGGQGDSAGGGDSGGERSPADIPLDKLTAEQLMIKAKRAYRKKRFDDALTYLQQAEKIEPENYRVKKMMGSVFYIMGWEEYASKYYQQSLDIEPNQPKIQSALTELQGGQQ